MEPVLSIFVGMLFATSTYLMMSRHTIRILIGVAVFGASVWGFTVAFRNRSGGRTFRVKAPRR